MNHTLIPIQAPAETTIFVKEATAESPLGTMVWLHGLGESSLCFETVAADPALARWHQVLPDLPGYGRSAWLEKPLNLKEFSDLVAAVPDVLGTPPFVLVGHSMGGVIGQLSVERHPDRWNAFLNVEGNISTLDCTFSSRAAAMNEARFISEGWQSLRDWVYEMGINHPPARSYSASLAFADPRSFHQNSCELIEASEAEDLAPRFARLPLPTLFVAGLDGGLSPLSLQLLGLAGANFAGIEGAGHWPFLDRKDVFLEQLGSFLEGMPSRK